MNRKISFLVTGCFCAFHLGFAQDVQPVDTPFSETFQTSILGQLEEEKERTYQMLDSASQASGTGIVFTKEDVHIARRIKRMENVIPLEYNAKVKAYLDQYMSANYKPYMEKLLGLSAYYFPIYSEIFAQQGIPEEVKYLSVVESSLDPHTVSRAGAVGLWQFIYVAAKGYNLSMDRHYDERKDVYSSTYAASSYLNDAYDEFGDWLLAIASYNCGRGGVRRAIRRSGLSRPNFWQLSPYLPRETQNYIPKFIAMSYILGHPEMYGLEAQPNDLEVAHRTLMVDRNVRFDRLAEALGCENDLLAELNPAYKNGVIDGTPEKPRRLIIPHREAVNDSAVYAALNEHIDASLVSVSDVGSHRVLPGETLQHIALEYGTTVQNILAWNDLSPASPIVGRLLRVKQIKEERLADSRTDGKAPASRQVASQPEYSTYVVRKGDTLSGIAKRHPGVSVGKLKSDNKLRNTRLRVGQQLKIFSGQE